MKIGKNTFSIARILTLLSFGSLLGYSILRAYFLSFTHDESISFALSEGSEILANTANNHLLNTMLIGVCKKLFGSNELALRLPNVLSLIVYLVGCFCLLSISKNKWLLLFGLSLTILNPFMFEFFSLARGYGLSLGFMLWSIFFLLENELCYRSYFSFLKAFISALGFASLAVYANLSMINVFIAILILFTVKYYLFLKEHTQTSWKQHAGFVGILLLGCIPLLLGINRLLVLQEFNQLYFGSSTLLGMLNSIVVASLYYTTDYWWIPFLIKYTFLMAFFTGTVSLIVKKDYYGRFFWITCLIIILIIGLLMEHFMFGAKYPKERAAIFCIPIFALYIFYLASHIMANYTIKKKYGIILGVCLITPLLFNFLTSINLTYTKTWRYDAHTKEVMEIIDKKTQMLDYKASISNQWLLEPAINYYIVSRKMNIKQTDRTGINLNTDFIYAFENNATSEGYASIHHFEDINTNLLIRQH